LQYVTIIANRLLFYRINNIVVLELNYSNSDSTRKKDEDEDDKKGIEGSKTNYSDKKNNPTNETKPIDPRFKRLLWYMIGSARGGINRARIIDFLTDNPSNANQLSNQLKLDYKTVIHHLNVLKKNSLVITDNEESYGATYFISPLMEKNYPAFVEIMDRIGKK
jgi:DNA-binding transcriptional ArsR family regulator